MEKPIEEFRRNHKSSTGYLKTCTPCIVEKRSTKPQYSLREAINAKCKECIYDPYHKGSWLMQVDQCCSGGCPLHSVRPRSSKGVS